MSLYFYAAIALVMALLSVAVYAEHASVKIARADEKQAKDTLASYVKQQQDYVAKLIVDYGNAADAAERKAKDDQSKLATDIDALRKEATAIPNRNVAVSGAIVDVLRHANAPAFTGMLTAPAAKPSATDVADSGSVCTEGQRLDDEIDVIEWAKACEKRVRLWEQYYGDTRAATCRGG